MLKLLINLLLRKILPRPGLESGSLVFEKTTIWYVYIYIYMQVHI